MSSERKPNLHLETAHVLFMDIVGYSKLLVGEQREVVEQLNRVVRKTPQFRQSEAARKLIRIPVGDGMALVFFQTPEEPVQCAMEIARALKNLPQIRLRMGVHSGPVDQVRDVNNQINVAGVGINIAQRVMAVADAGHILLSKRVAEDLAQDSHWQPHLHELGEVEVKHGERVGIVNFYTEELGNPEMPVKYRLAEEAKQSAAAASGKGSAGRSRVLVPLVVAAGAVAAIGFYVFSHWWKEPAPSVPAEKSIAVLPFQNLSSDQENAYFTDGIQDEILTRLSKIADLKVISRTSTQHYKSTPEHLTEIASQLGVAYVVEGSVQKSGDAVRVNVQLIMASNDSHLWADTFDRKLTDIFSVESEVARAIADQLRAHISGPEEQVITAKPTANPEAYDAYLRGLAYNLKTANTSGNSLAAQKYLREAVRLDPMFALSWALLSYVDARGYISLRLQPTAALQEETRHAADTALALQPNLGEAILAKGFYHYACLKEYDTAVHYFEQARQFLPNSSRIPELLAYVARRQGQWDRSESFFHQAEQLDPRNVNLLTQHALSYLHARRFPEALRKFNQVLDITPDDVNTLALEAAIAQAEGDLPRAAELLAPLHPGADDSSALETQVYQAILERRPVQIILRLQGILEKPDPALGYINGELRFWLGWAQEVAGDEAAARESWQKARGELEPFLTEQPGNYILIGDLALINMALGDKAKALPLSEQAAGMISIAKDALEGPQPIETIARVAARFGETDRAIASLEKLLSIPYEGPLASGLPLTPALLRLDPMFDPLRKDSRFQKLAASPLPNKVKR